MGERRRGRPTKLTPETQKLICDAVAAGVPVQVAARLAGVSQSTYYAWVSRHRDFADAVKKAYAVAESRLVGYIYRAAAKTWTAAAWLLERHPQMRQRWMRRLDSGSQTNSTNSIVQVVAPDAAGEAQTQSDQQSVSS
jgi:hypothetical protein